MQMRRNETGCRESLQVGRGGEVSRVPSIRVNAQSQGSWDEELERAADGLNG
jgi:hypothetical protein